MLRLTITSLVWTSAFVLALPILLAGGFFFSLFVATLFPLVGLMYIVYTEKTIDTLYMANSTIDLYGANLVHFEKLGGPPIKELVPTEGDLEKNKVSKAG